MPPKRAAAAKKRPAATAALGGAKRPRRGPKPCAVPSGAPGLCVAGEALIDFLPRETKDGEACWLPKAGGAPFNVCVAARRLGLPVHFFSGMSTDMFGQDLFKQLESEGVDLSTVRRIARPTTLAFVSKAPGQDVKYAFFKENAADRSLTSKDSKNAMEGRSIGALHMSLGAVTFEDAQMTEAFYELYGLAQSKGTFTSFDPNLRPSMIDGGAEKYRKKVEDFLGLVDLAKASDADLEFLYGAGADLSKIASQWLDLGARLVVITRGPEGATAYYHPAKETTASVSAAPPGQQPNTIDAAGRSAPVVDTVGAGDTCMGALLFGCLGGGGGKALTQQLRGGTAWDAAAVERLQEILRHAVAAAAINVSRAGCDPPTQEELRSAMAAVAAA